MNFDVSVEFPNQTGVWNSNLSATYDVWRKCWDKAFELTKPGYFHPSDAFSRQHEVISFVDKKSLKVAGLVCHRYVDTSRPDVFDDSFFQFWPLELRKTIRLEGERLAIGSQITIDENFRGDLGGFKLKELISALSLSRVMNSGADIVVGMMLVDKGMSTHFQSIGADLRLKGVDYHGMKIDLVTFDPKRWKPEFSDEIKKFINLNSNYLMNKTINWGNYDAKNVA